MPKNINDYVNQAKQAIDGSYALRLQQLQQTKNNQLSEYDQNAIDTTSAYDKQIKDNTNAGIMRVNNYNNNVLARNLGRSSIATTGMAGINNETDDLENQIKLEKQNKLDQITKAKQLYNQGYDSNVAALTADQQATINKYAQDLYNTDLAYERQRALQLAKSGGSSGVPKTDTKARAGAKSTIEKSIGSISDPVERIRFVQNNYDNIMNSLGSDDYAKSAYNSMLNGAQDYYNQTHAYQTYLAKHVWNKS